MSQLNTHYLSTVFRLTILHIVTFIIKFSMETLYSGMYSVIVQYVLYGSSTIDYKCVYYVEYGVSLHIQSRQ